MNRLVGLSCRVRERNDVGCLCFYRFRGDWPKAILIRTAALAAVAHTIAQENTLKSCLANVWKRG